MVAAKLSVVRKAMADAADRANRDPAAITLVAVTKGQSADVVMAA